MFRSADEGAPSAADQEETFCPEFLLSMTNREAAVDFGQPKRKRR